MATLNWYEKPSSSGTGKIVIKASAGAGTTGDVVHIMDKVAGCVLVATPGAGNARWEYTFDRNKEVHDDPASASWITWEAGDVTAITAVRLPESPTAARMIAGAAACTGTITGSRRR